jgi:hypothetical protein
MNVDKVNIENVFRIFKNRSRILITSMHILIKLLKLWWFVVSFMTIVGVPLLSKCLQIDPLYGAKDKCLFLMKVKQLHKVEKQCVLHFSQIG